LELLKRVLFHQTEQVSFVNSLSINGTYCLTVIVYVFLGVLVAFALAISNEGLIAAWQPAHEILFSFVDSFMNAQVSTLREGLGADLALVRLLLGVSSHVGLQSVVSRELGRTLSARKWLFFSMDSSVVLQMSLSGETFVTPLKVTRKRLEAFVRVYVVLEPTLLEELLAALGTLVFRLFVTLR
jgi:hypothetical protein